jgi:hypothetical protein
MFFFCLMPYLNSLPFTCYSSTNSFIVESIMQNFVNHIFRMHILKEDSARTTIIKIYSSIGIVEYFSTVMGSHGNGLRCVVPSSGILHKY